MDAENHTVQGRSDVKATEKNLRRLRFTIGPLWGWIVLGILLGVPCTYLYLVLPRVEEMREPESAEERSEWFALVREVAGIAELPPSATDVRIARSGWSGARVFLVRFGADANDIEAFLASSPVLEGSRPVVFPPGKKLTTRHHRADGYSISAYDDWPSWFDPWLEEGGRMYRRGPDADYELSWVIVNDGTRVVYAYMTWGQ